MVAIVVCVVDCWQYYITNERERKKGCDMRDEFRRKTMSNNGGEFGGTYRNADLYGAGHTKRINEQKRKEKRRARRSMKQEFELEYLGEWLHW